MKLYEIDKRITDWFVKNCDPETGELIVDDNAAKEFEELQEAKETKIENIALYIKNLKYLVQDIQTEKAELDKRMKTAKKRVEWLSGYLLAALDGKTFETAKCSIKYRKSSEVVIDEETFIADDANKDLYEIEEKIKISKTAVKEAIKTGREVAGAEIAEKVNIQIK